MEPASKGPKACTTCAKAKARCIPGPDKDSKCERYGSGHVLLTCYGFAPCRGRVLRRAEIPGGCVGAADLISLVLGSGLQ
jgi:hypothetical protein